MFFVANRTHPICPRISIKSTSCTTQHRPWGLVCLLSHLDAGAGGGRKLCVGCRRRLRAAAGMERVRGLRGAEPPPLPSSFVPAAAPAVVAAAPAGVEPHAEQGEGGEQRQAGDGVPGPFLQLTYQK